MAEKQAKRSATMVLPVGGKEAWTRIMQGEELPSNYDSAYRGQPLVAAHATFPDGTHVIGGVIKGESREWSSIFMWTFDRDGRVYADDPIDVSDAEDFHVGRILFRLDPDDESGDYELTVAEQQPNAPAAPAPAKDAQEPAKPAAGKKAPAKPATGKTPVKKATAKKTTVKKAAVKTAAKKTSAPAKAKPSTRKSK